MEHKFFKTAPAVFAVGNEYQIMVPVKISTVMWVKVGNEEYHDDSNGILRSSVSIHRMSVPMDELNREKKYTVCYREVFERKPYYSETSEVFEEEYSFRPVECKNPICYHISDAHGRIETPVKAAKEFEKKFGKIDFLILNGDVIDHSGEIEKFDNIYEIASQITNGEIPVLFSRGNHDTRGIYAENIAEYTPCQNGNSFFTFRLGNIWGIVIDCGEDKVDTSCEYGNTIACHAFRKRETAFIESVIKNAENEYLADGVEHRIVVGHVPFTREMGDIFTIEREIYTYWSNLLRENIKPEVMICGHLHENTILYPGEEKDINGHPCPIAVICKPEDDKFTAGGVIFKKDIVIVVHNDSDGKFLAEENIKI